MGTQVDWSALATVYIHPVKIQIIEALERLDVPMSPSDLQREFRGSPSVSAIDYHLKSLAHSGVVEALEREPGKQGKTITPYKLAASFLHSVTFGDT